MRKTDTTYTPQTCERLRKFHYVTPNGVVFDWELAGSSGAAFVLLRESHHTDEDIAEAEKYLRRERDVVRLCEARVVVIRWDNLPEHLLQTPMHPQQGFSRVVAEAFATLGPLDEGLQADLLDRGRACWKAGGLRVDCPQRLSIRETAVWLVGYNLCTLAGKCYGELDPVDALARECEENRSDGGR